MQHDKVRNGVKDVLGDKEREWGQGKGLASSQPTIEDLEVSFLSFPSWMSATQSPSRRRFLMHS